MPSDSDHETYDTDRESARSSFEDWLDEQPEPGLRSISLGHRPSFDETTESFRRLEALKAREVPQADGQMARRLMLAAACTFSIGSHYGSYVLGPIKGRLHSSESGFAALISASQLVNTVTPLVAGSLVPKFGAAKCGLAATGTVLLGQLIVCWGEREGEEPLGWMILGLGVFGLGIAPLAVVQETIILASRRHESKAVGRSVAIGLLLGKLASFAAASTAEPLANISPRLPFITAASLSFISFTASVCYAFLERRLPSTPPVTVGLDEHKAGQFVSWSEVTRFGDPFFFYLAVCSLAGTWFTAIHGSSSLLKTIYDVPSAALISSSILFSSVVLYPIIGWWADKQPHILPFLFKLAVGLMALTFLILIFLSSIIPLSIAVIPLAVGIGPAALLLVLAVPRIVERHQNSTALGLHKSAEMAGAVIIQAGSSFLLASSDDPRVAAFRVIKQLLILCLLQLAVIIFWWQAVQGRQMEASSYGLLPEEALPDEASTAEREAPPPLAKGSRSTAETRRGRLGLIGFVGLVGSAWLVYLVNLTRKE